jgi:hypothetical protein
LAKSSTENRSPSLLLLLLLLLLLVLVAASVLAAPVVARAWRLLGAGLMRKW